MEWIDPDKPCGTVRERFGKIGRLTPDNRVIAEVMDGYLAELLRRVERLERVVDFMPMRSSNNIVPLDDGTVMILSGGCYPFQVKDDTAKS